MHKYEFDQYLNRTENICIIYRSNDLSAKMHTHEFVEMLFVVSGTSEQFVDGVRYIVEPGDLMFINYGQSHSYLGGTSDFAYYNLLYVPEFFGDELINSENIYEIFEISLFREFTNKKVCTEQIVHFRGTEYAEVKKILESMHKEFRKKRIGYRSILNGYSRILFSEILRKLKNDDASDEAQGYIHQVITDCLTYIDAHGLEKVTLKEIAQHTFYNSAYLGRIFKEYFGKSLAEYMKEKRIQEAAHLLLDSDLNNEEIMERIGYTDKKQFYQYFRDIYHETPAQFRKNKRRFQ